MRYRFRVKGILSPRVTRMFAGFDAVHGDATTDLVGPVEDQAELYGVLLRLRDLGLPLVEASPVG